MGTPEAIALVGTAAALLIGIAALWLDVRIMRELHPHHHMIRELHHHHLGAASQQPGHEDCHGPVYRRDAVQRCLACQDVPEGYGRELCRRIEGCE